MKTMRKLFFSTLIIVLVTGYSSVLSGSGKDLQKTYTWKYNVNRDATVAMNNYDCNLTIHVWDKAEAEYHLMVDAETRSDEDAAALDLYLQNLKFSNTTASVKFENTIWESRNSIMGKTTIILKGGKKVYLSEISMKGELWIPSGCKFQLDSKYSEINLENFGGQLFMDLYNDVLYAGNVLGRTEIDDKYSTMEFKEMRDIKAVLYNSKIEATGMGNLIVDSKYSKITSGVAGDLEIESYNDKYNFTRTGDLTFSAKYSDIKTESSGQIVLDCYEGTIILREVKDVKLNSKYADFHFVAAGNITVISAYNDKLEAGKINSLKITESKYCSYRVEELVNSVSESDGYEDKFTILKTGQDFREFRISGKYIEASLNVPATMDYKFRAKITYPKLEMNESQLKSKTKIIEGSNLEYDAVKGVEKDGMPLIEVNGYEMGLKITEN
jgi:hypothetical protein